MESQRRAIGLEDVEESVIGNCFSINQTYIII